MAEFTLRAWKGRDASSLYKHAHNRKIADMLKDAFPYPYTYEDAKMFVSSCIEREGKDFHCMAIVAKGEAVGCISVEVGKDVYKRCAEIGFWLGEEYWGQDIMTNAVKMMVEDAFSMFDIVRIGACVFENNLGSVRTLEKAGFTLEGRLKKGVCKNGEIFDLLLFGITR